MLTYLKAPSTGSVCGGCGRDPQGDTRLSMTRQGEENITNDDLDEEKRGWPQLRKETKKIDSGRLTISHKNIFPILNINILSQQQQKNHIATNKCVMKR